LNDKSTLGWLRHFAVPLAIIDAYRINTHRLFAPNVALAAPFFFVFFLCDCPASAKLDIDNIEYWWYTQGAFSHREDGKRWRAT